MNPHDTRKIIAELTRAKCAVQLRTIQMVMGLPANDARLPAYQIINNDGSVLCEFDGEETAYRMAADGYAVRDNPCLPANDHHDTPDEGKGL